MNKELPAVVPAVVILTVVAFLAVMGYRTIQHGDSAAKVSHEAAITRANCIGKCHSETQMAALIASKNGIKSHLKWQPNDYKGKVDNRHSTDPEVVAILNNYFTSEPPQK
jgi:hypothetical protein